MHNRVRGDKFMKKTYTIVIHETDSDETGYWAQCLEIPGAITQGETIEEIKKNMKEAIELMLEEEYGENIVQEKKIILEKITLEVQHA